jgi:hypothetical protein
LVVLKPGTSAQRLAGRRGRQVVDGLGVGEAPAVDLHRNSRRQRRIKAANTAIKHIKPTGRGYRNRRHSRPVSCYAATGRHAGDARLNQQAITANCG